MYKLTRDVIQLTKPANIIIKLKKTSENNYFK